MNININQMWSPLKAEVSHTIIENARRNDIAVIKDTIPRPRANWGPTDDLHKNKNRSAYNYETAKGKKCRDREQVLRKSQEDLSTNHP